MRLSQDDAELFYKLNAPLLLYTNEQMDVIQGISTPDAFMELPIEEKGEIRNALYENIELIDSFVKENSFGLSPEELEIVHSWRDFVAGTFYLFRYLKNYTVFLDSGSPPKAYGVLAIHNTFDEFFGTTVPIMVQTVLLPFKGRIIYDGFMAPYNIIFGGGIRRSLDDSYREAKARFGIITSLPFSGAEQSDADILKAYLRTKRSREIHWEEIEELINKDNELLVLYHQEMGKIHARKYKQRLRELGLSDSWFGILDGMIIASGATKPKVERTLKDVLPGEKRGLVYIFHLE
jgi:hypothetical protein